MAVTSTTLGKACTLKAGKFVAANDIADEYRDGLFPCYGGNGIRGYVTEYSHEGEYPLIGRQGALCGNVNFASGKFRATEHAVVVQPNVQMNIRWLYYKLLSMDLGQYATGAAQPGLAVAKLEQLPFVMPSLEEQERLSTLCDQVEVLISLRKQQIAKLDELVKARFVEMFGDPATNPMKWKLMCITDVCDDICGGGTPSKSHPEYYEGNIPWVSPKDMKTLVISDSIDHITEVAIENSTARLIPANSVLMVIRSGILKHTLPVAINGVPVTINQDMKAFMPGKEITASYLMYYFKAIESDVLSGVRAVTADNIDFKAFQKRSVMVPPLSLQHQFAAFVAQTDQQKLTIQHSLAQLELLKKALMQKYFG